MPGFVFYPVELKFSEVFAVSANKRKSTKTIFVIMNSGDHIAYGQASYPPYLSANREEDILFLRQVKDLRIIDHNDIKGTMDRLDAIAPGHYPAKAAIDMAMYDLLGKEMGVPVRHLIDTGSKRTNYTSFTIGIGNDDFIKRQLVKASEFRLLKLKLGSDISQNQHTINLVKELSTQRLGVDFNQAFKNRNAALEMIYWLHEADVEYAEQPLHADMEDDQLWLREESPMDIFGDESFQDMSDLFRRQHQFHGINVKLMKCGGITRAHELVSMAKLFGMKAMLGCMAESCLAVMAAAHIADMFDRLDLDGHLMISNDVFTGLNIEGDSIILNDEPGLGLTLK